VEENRATLHALEYRGTYSAKYLDSTEALNTFEPSNDSFSSFKAVIEGDNVDMRQSESAEPPSLVKTVLPFVSPTATRSSTSIPGYHEKHFIKDTSELTATILNDFES
jgi:hypothetical protein